MEGHPQQARSHPIVVALPQRLSSLPFAIVHSHVLMNLQSNLYHCSLVVITIITIVVSLSLPLYLRGYWRRSPYLTSSMDVNFVAGLAAGAATTVVNHPLDVVKVKLQLHRQPLRALLLLLSWRDYTRGIGPNLVGNIAAWGMYFGVYEYLKPVTRRYTPLDTALYVALLTMAGILTLVVTNPIWVIKTRMLGGDRHRSLLSLVRDMLRNEGVLSLWKGLVPLLFLVGQALLQFTIYDHGKQWVQRRSHRQQNTTYEHVYLLAGSKVAAMTIMYPAQVVKLRLQYQKVPTKVATVVKQVAAERAFYLGLSANIVRVVPATTVTFVVFELVKRWLEGNVDM